MAEESASPGAPAASRHRRRYLLDRGFQLKYALLMAAAGLVVALVFGLWLHQAHAQATALLTQDPETRALIARGDRLLLGAFVGIAVLLAAALFLLGVVVTHRVAGPVFVMGHYLAIMAQGRFPRMRALRRGDELKGLFRTFIDAVEALKAREAGQVAVLEDAIARMRAAAPRAPELLPAIEALAGAAAERRAALAENAATPAAVRAPDQGAGAA